MRFAPRYLLPILGLGVLHADSINLTPGSLLVASPTQAITTADTINYTKTGSILSTGQITGTGDLAESLTVLDGNLFVSDGAGRVNQINLASGAVSSYFSTGMVGLEGLGSLNGNLLTLSFSSTAVRVYSTSGLLQTSINLGSLPSSFDWTGLASDGSVLYLSDYLSGHIYEYSTAGVQLGYLETGITNGLVGLSFDASNHSLWITNSLFGGPSQVIDLSTAGVQLSAFSTGSFYPFGGIAVVPGGNVPEPASSGLLFIAGMLAFATKLYKTRAGFTLFRTPQVSRETSGPHSARFQRGLSPFAG